MLEAIGSLAAVLAVGWGANASVGTPWVAWVTVIAGAGLAWFRLKPRAYGLMLVGLPGAFGLMVTPGGLTQRAMGGLALMVGYWAAWSALQSRDEETRFGWWPAIILALWQPSAWAVLGIAFLAASSSRTWRGSLAAARGAQMPHGASRTSWAVVAAGVVAAALIAWPLPRPGGFEFHDAAIVIPRFEIPASRTSPPPPIFSGGGSSLYLTLPRPSAWWWFAVFAVIAVWFGWRGRSTLAALRAGKIKKRKLALDWGLPLALLTSWLMAFVFSALPGPVGQVRTLELSIPLGPIFVALYALGLVALVWRAWVLLRGLLERAGWRATEPILLPARRVNHVELPADRVRAAYARWLVHLRDLEWPRAPWETPFEFSRRVTAHAEAMRQDTRAITEAYERVRYGGAPSDLEARAVEEAVARWLEIKLEPQNPIPEETEALGTA
jgi:Domain of unknown function (DUF4129)